MTFEMEKLGYAHDKLNPAMSALTMDFHYGKHYNAYVNNLNNLIKGTEFEKMPLEEIIMKSDGGIFNNAAQASNHGIFFTQLTPGGRVLADGKLAKAIEKSFGSFDKMKIEMSDRAKKLFGSGWVWLAANKSTGELKILDGGNAYTPVKDGLVPIMNIDVWEHAYYLDYQNRRPDFVDAIWDILDWEVVEERLRKM